LAVPIPSQALKLLMMGLSQVGKSSIQSVVFEGKKPEDVADYAATRDYERSTKDLLGSTFQIFDCGGQESFLIKHTGALSEFIFGNVQVYIWVVDVSSFDEVSKSKYYFDLAINQLHKYSPEATVFCLFHKIDLLVQESREEIITNMKEFFRTDKPLDVYYYATSIFEKDLFKAFGDIIKRILAEKSTIGQSVSEALQSFIQENVDTFFGMGIYTDEGLPVIEEGDYADDFALPINLWLFNTDRIEGLFNTVSTLKGSIETDDYMFLFQRIKDELHFTGIAKKTVPKQYVQVKIDQIIDRVYKLLEEFDI
jgi:GTPase SAR1 family protein